MVYLYVTVTERRVLTLSGWDVTGWAGCMYQSGWVVCMYRWAVSVVRDSYDGMTYVNKHKVIDEFINILLTDLIDISTIYRQYVICAWGTTYTHTHTHTHTHTYI